MHLGHVSLSENAQLGHKEDTNYGEKEILSLPPFHSSSPSYHLPPIPNPTYTRSPGDYISCRELRRSVSSVV